MSATAAATSGDLRSLLLSTLATAGVIEDTSAFAAARGLDHTAVVGAVKSLEAKTMIVTTQQQRDVLQLTAEAEGYAASGTPEFQVWQATGEAGSSGTAWRGAGTTARL